MSGFINRSQVVNAALHTAAVIFLIFWLVGLKNLYERLAGQRRNVPEMDAYRFALNFHEAKRVGLNGFSKLDKVRKVRNINTSPPAIKVYLLRWHVREYFFRYPSGHYQR